MSEDEKAEEEALMEWCKKVGGTILTLWNETPPVIVVSPDVSTSPEGMELVKYGRSKNGALRKEGMDVTRLILQLVHPPSTPEGLMTDDEAISMAWRIVGTRSTIDSATLLADAMAFIEHYTSVETGVVKIPFSRVPAMEKVLQEAPSLPPNCFFTGSTALWILTGGEERETDVLDIASFGDFRGSIEWLMNEYPCTPREAKFSWRPLFYPPDLELDVEEVDQTSGQTGQTSDQTSDQTIDSRVNTDYDHTPKPKLIIVRDCSTISGFSLFDKVLSPSSIASMCGAAIASRMTKSIHSLNFSALLDMEVPIGRRIPVMYTERVTDGMERSDFTSSSDMLIAGLEKETKER